MKERQRQTKWSPVAFGLERWGLTEIGDLNGWEGYLIYEVVWVGGIREIFCVYLKLK